MYYLPNKRRSDFEFQGACGDELSTPLTHVKTERSGFVSERTYKVGRFSGTRALAIRFLLVFWVFSFAFMAMGQGLDRGNVGVGSVIDKAGSDFGTSVDFSTGKANISIPLTSLDARGISVPISISYQTGGIKASDLSKEVGLGWTLSAGGMIQRQIRGLPDRMWPIPYPPNNKIFFCNRETDIHKFYTDYSQMPSITTPNGVRGKDANFLNNPKLVGFNHSTWWSFDASNDLYFFTCPAGSGEFVVTDHGEIITSQPTGLKISFQAEIAEEEGYWLITDKSGNQYKFGSKQVNRGKSSQSSKTFRMHATELVVLEFNEEPIYSDRYTCWMMDEIRSSTSQDVVTLEYAKESNVKDEEESYIGQVTNYGATPLDNAPNRDEYLSHPATPEVHLKFLIETDGDKVMNENNIWYSTNCDSGERIDLLRVHNVFHKDQFRLTDAYTDIDRVKLLYRTFDTNGSDEENNLVEFIVRTTLKQGTTRLCEKIKLEYASFQTLTTDLHRSKLVSISKFNETDEKRNMYSFTYFDPKFNYLKARSYAFDHWGYYNARNEAQPGVAIDPVTHQKQDSDLGPLTFNEINTYEDRHAATFMNVFYTRPWYVAMKSQNDLGAMQSYSIREITNPGGAKLLVTYEANTALSETGVVKPAGGLRVKALTVSIPDYSKTMHLVYGTQLSEEPEFSSGRLFSEEISYARELFIAKRDPGWSCDGDWALYYDYRLQGHSKPTYPLFDHQGNCVRYSSVYSYEDNKENGWIRYDYKSYPDLTSAGLGSSIRFGIVQDQNPGFRVFRQRSTVRYAPERWWKTNLDWSHVLGLVNSVKAYSSTGNLVSEVTNSYSFGANGPVSYNYEVRDLVIDGTTHNYPAQAMHHYFTEHLYQQRYSRLDKTEATTYFANGSQSKTLEDHIYHSTRPYLLKRKETSTDLGQRKVFEEVLLAFEFTTLPPNYSPGNSAPGTTVLNSQIINDGSDPVQSLNGFVQNGEDYITGASMVFKRNMVRNHTYTAGENPNLAIPSIGSVPYTFANHIPVVAETWQLKYNKPIRRSLFTDFDILGTSIVYDERYVKMSEITVFDCYFNPVTTKDRFSRLMSTKYGRKGTIATSTPFNCHHEAMGILNFEGEPTDFDTEKFYYPERIENPSNANRHYSAEAYTGTGACELDHGGRSPTLVLKQSSTTGDLVKAVDVSFKVKLKTGATTANGTLYIDLGGNPKSFPFTATNEWQTIKLSHKYPTIPLTVYQIRTDVVADVGSEKFIIDDLMMVKAGMDVSILGYDVFNRPTSVTDINHRTVRKEYNSWGEYYLGRDHNGDITDLKYLYIKPTQ